MRANPGGEIDPADVLGRDRLIQSIWRVLERQSLELTAERRIGKSSVIKKMTAEPAGGFAAVYQDLEGIRTRLQFVESVYRQAASFLSRRKKTAHRLQRLVRTLSGTEIRGLRLPRVAAPDWKRLLVAICEDLQEHLDGLLVFFWDEMPFMLQNIRAGEGSTAAREVLDVLRGVRQTNQAIRMVFTGSIGLHHVLAELRGGAQVSHAPMNDMDRLDVPPLARQDAKELAQRIIAGEGLSGAASDDAAAVLADEVNGIAYYVHLVLDGLVKDGREATPQDVRRLVKRKIQDPTDPWNLAHFLQRAAPYYGKERGLALALLDALAGTEAMSRAQLVRVAQAIADVRDPHEVTTMLARLTNDHYVAADDEGRFRFCYSVVQRWWRHHRVDGLGGDSEESPNEGQA
jgi:hypothetical protein